MPNSNPIVDDPNQTKRSDKANEKSDENVAIEDELTFEFRMLMGHLENLYSDQCYLTVLSREASKRAPEIVAAIGPEQSRENVAQAATPAVLESAVIHATFDEHEASRWALMLDVPQSVVLPPTQNQCGAKHWEILKDAASAIEDALLSLSSYQGQEPVENYVPVPVIPEDENVEHESEWARLEAEVTRRIAQSIKQVRGEVNPEADGFYLSQLQRELDSIVLLVRCAANSCILVGDFNAATVKAEAAPESDGFPFAKVSRAVCWVGKSLGQRANEIEASSRFLLEYIEKRPGTAPKAGEIKEINRFCRKVRKEASADQSTMLFTPNDIGKLFLQRNPDTARSLIEEMREDKVEAPFFERQQRNLHQKAGPTNASLLYR